MAERGDKSYDVGLLLDPEMYPYLSSTSVAPVRRLAVYHSYSDVNAKFASWV